MIAYLLIFAIVGVYAVLGNFIAYLMLLSRGIPMRPFFAGVPGYLYRICVVAGPSVSINLRRFCLSTSVAFLAAGLLGLGLAGFAQ
jgi:hypothetical protein